jgi:hypothetical protein
MKKCILPFISCFIIVFMSVSTGICQTVTNGSLNGTATGWTAGCNPEVTFFETGYGGPSGTNYVSEVDNTPSSLCQTISGFTPGNSYTLYLDLGRRISGNPPTTVGVDVCFTDPNNSANTTCTTFTRSNTTWGLTNSTFNFTAPAITSGNSLILTIKAVASYYTEGASGDATATCPYEPGAPKGCGDGYGIIVDNISFDAPTPVTLLDFKAAKNASEVDIKWQTATEINNDYFIVEKSKNGIDFTSIGRTRGAGNSNTVQEYFMTDHTPLSGISYYHLKQVDYDGKFSYSKIVAVKNEDPEISIYPNPSSSSFNIKIPNDKEPYSLEVRDAKGSLVYQRAEDSSDFSIEISGLSKGVYILILILGMAGVVIIRKLVVS